MPHEYTAPGVYVEEVKFGARSICGVSTSKSGFVGRTLAAIDSGGPVKVLLFGVLVGSGSSVVVHQSRRHYAKRLARKVDESFPTTQLRAAIDTAMAVGGVVGSIFKGSRSDDDDDDDE